MPSLVILLYVVFENVLWVIDELKWTAVAIDDLNGGGPEGMHSHPHNHLFIVTSGEARVEYEDETVIIHENEAFGLKAPVLMRYGATLTAEPSWLA